MLKGMQRLREARRGRRKGAEVQAMLRQRREQRERAREWTQRWGGGVETGGKGGQLGVFVDNPTVFALARQARHSILLQVNSFISELQQLVRLYRVEGH